MNKIKVEVPFNGIESELVNLKNSGIEVVGMFVEEGNGNTCAILQGLEGDIKGYLAKLWEVDIDGEEIEEIM